MNRQLSLLAILLVSIVGGLIGSPPESILRSALSSYVYPVLAPQLSSNFGMRRHPVLRKFTRQHNGVDLAAPEGALVRALSGGLVVFADPYAGFGNLVVLQHKSGVTTHYGHCAKLKVKPGQRVKTGEIIATVGSTGLSTGPHLHLEIRLNGEALDPLKIIPDLGADAAG